MEIVLKIIAATAAISVVFTIWLLLLLVSTRGIQSMLGAGALGVITLAGWAATLVLGPFTAVQLWRLKESGRMAGLVLFAIGALYYVAGLLWLRSAEEASGQIAAAVIAYALPAVILALPAARRACR
jgi:hypothetical protein